MCGIVGLFARDPSFEPSLARHLSEMLVGMTSRGPDSAGLALWSAPGAGVGRSRLSLLASSAADRGAEPPDWSALATEVESVVGGSVTAADHGDAAVLSAEADGEVMAAAVREIAPDVVAIGFGSAIEVFKHTGIARRLVDAYPVADRAAHQGLGHTRMATESAVTTAHSHPFCPADDLALVHNGSFSNYATVRRDLAADGVRFDTDNDSEVAARLIATRLAAGDDLAGALGGVLDRMDGFFTLAVGTADEFAVVRDAFACKPAVIAETDRYVAVASEYHALSGLPEIEKASVWEPMPEEVYRWAR
ncbi:MAG: hypothetical protein S0880_23050 [Actinomycetota bacterium]|nr:hypothetical protein [Actinomycetota bacterium]